MAPCVQEICRGLCSTSRTGTRAGDDALGALLIVPPLQWSDAPLLMALSYGSFDDDDLSLCYSTLDHIGPGSTRLCNHTEPNIAVSCCHSTLIASFVGE